MDTCWTSTLMIKICHNPSKWVKIRQNPSNLSKCVKMRQICQNPSKTVIIRHNPSKSVIIRQNPSKSVKVRQNPLKSGKIHQESLRNPTNSWGNTRISAQIHTEHFLPQILHPWILYFFFYFHFVFKRVSEFFKRFALENMRQTESDTVCDRNKTEKSKIHSEVS